MGTLALTFVGSGASAVVACPPRRTAFQDLRSAGLTPLNVVWVGEAERKTAADYGKPNLNEAQVKRRYAATGDFMCDTGDGQVNFGQAQVTLRNNVITTAGHNLNGYFDCKKQISPNKCNFIIEIEGEKLTYPVQSMAGAGYECPKRDNRVRDEDEDWLVLKLKKPVDARVKPYDIPRTRNPSIAKGTKVTAIGKSRDWPIDNTSLKTSERPRHYGDCEVQAAKNFGMSGKVETDCDSGKGFSGGSLVSPGKDPTLLAMHVSSSTKGPGCDPNLGSDGHDTYHPGCWTEFAVPVTGKFQEAILTAANLSFEKPPQDSPAVNRPPEGFRLPSIKMK